jgi:hypothetical protein
VLDPNDHATAVDVANLEGGHLAHPQPRAISCGQSRPVAQPRHRLQEADDLLAAEHYRQFLRFFGSLALMMRSNASGRPSVTPKKKRKAHDT